MPEKIISTLTLSILKSVHTLKSPIFSYKLYSMATLRHFKPLLLENYNRIIAFMPNLQRVSFYSVIEFLYHSSTTKVIPSLILIRGSYLGCKASQLYGKLSSALWLLWRVQIQVRSRHGWVPRVEAINYFGLARNDPRTCHNTWIITETRSKVWRI